MRAITGADLPSSGTQTGTFGDATHVPVFAVDATGRITGVINVAIATAGTVTSVGLTAPSLFTITGSPVTGAGTLAMSFASQSANLVLASPNGASGAPVMRAIVAADLPASGATAGTVGASTQIPVLTVDAKGRITGYTTAAPGGASVSWLATVPSNPTPGASPWVYHNTNAYALFVAIQGSVGQTVYLSKDGTTYFQVGTVSGSLILAPGWYMQVVYSTAPANVVFVPLF